MKTRHPFVKNHNAVKFPFKQKVINKLPDMKINDIHHGFHNVQNYLINFGYLEIEGKPIVMNKLDEKTEEALKKFQRTYGLQETGIFDAATKELMSHPRCAVPDYFTSSHELFYRTNGPWRRRELTYSFGAMTRQPVGVNNAQNAVRNACKTWGTYNNINYLHLEEVPQDFFPDILVEWRPAQDPDLNMVGDTLAHADFPPDYEILEQGLPQPVHFDDDEHIWATNGNGHNIDIETVALHEFGHILGLEHEPGRRNSVMFPQYTGEKRALTTDDLDGLKKLYPQMIENKPSLGDKLYPGMALKPGERIISPNKLFELEYQQDGNLVLYEGNRDAKWDSKTYGKKPGQAIMQNDGNFVIYDANGKAVFASGTNGFPGAELHLQSDRNLVIYHNNQPKWDSKTNLPNDNWPRPVRIPDDKPSHGDKLKPGIILHPDERIISPNRCFELEYQHDGNLVLYDGKRVPHWSSKTNGKTPGIAIMQEDGNFVIYDANGKAVFATGTNNNPGAELHLQSDRNLVVYHNNTPKWASNTQWIRNRPGFLSIFSRIEENNKAKETQDEILGHEAKRPKLSNSAAS